MKLNIYYGMFTIIMYGLHTFQFYAVVTANLLCWLLFFVAVTESEHLLFLCE